MPFPANGANEREWLLIRRDAVENDRRIDDVFACFRGIRVLLAAAGHFFAQHPLSTFLSVLEEPDLGDNRVFRGSSASGKQQNDRRCSCAAAVVTPLGSSAARSGIRNPSRFAKSSLSVRMV